MCYTIANLGNSQNWGTDSMELVEKTIGSETIFEGRIVRLHVDKVELPNGHQSTREVVEHPGGVCILPLDGEDMVTLVRQFRYPFHRVITELPAGKLDAGEDHRLCALRELKEEVGMTPDELIYLGALYSSPGFSGEIIHLYLARGLSQGACQPDEDEFLDLVRVPFDALVEQVMKCDVADGKTVAAVLKAKVLLGR